MNFNTCDEILQEMPVIEEIKEQCIKKGWTIIKSRKLSELAEQDFLRVVLVNNDKNEYVVYIYNRNDKAFYEGYYTTKYSVALEKWENKR